MVDFSIFSTRFSGLFVYGYVSYVSVGVVSRTAATYSSLLAEDACGEFRRYTAVVLNTNSSDSYTAAVYY